MNNCGRRKASMSETASGKKKSRKRGGIRARKDGGIREKSDEKKGEGK